MITLFQEKPDYPKTFTEDAPADPPVLAMPHLKMHYWLGRDRCWKRDVDGLRESDRIGEWMKLFQKRAWEKNLFASIMCFVLA